MKKIDPGIMDMKIVPRVENPEANRKWNDAVIDARREQQKKSSSKNWIHCRVSRQQLLFQ